MNRWEIVRCEDCQCWHAMHIETGLVSGVFATHHDFEDWVLAQPDEAA